MSNPIQKRVVRLAVDVTAFLNGGFTDFITQSSPMFWNAAGVEVQVAFFQGNPYNGAPLANVSELTAVNLLLTDMVMPGGMNGKQLAGQLVQQDPKLKVIYASGYTAEVAGMDLSLEDGVNFLTKPFEAHKLAQTVRSCLDKTGK